MKKWKHQVKVLTILLLAGITMTTQAQTTVVTAGTIQASDTIIEVPIFIDSFVNVASLSLTLEFDTSALEFIEKVNTATFSSNLISNVDGDKLLIAWFSLNPVTVATDTLVKLRFKRGAGCFSAMNWNLTSLGANQITDLNGTTLASNFVNGLVSFLIPDHPNLINPIDNSQDVFIYTPLNFTAAECFVNYQLQVATDTFFTNLVIDTLLQDTSFLPSNLNPSEIYHWRAGKVDTQDSVNWSPTWTFTTGNLANIRPSLPVIKAFSDTIVVPVIVDSLFDVTDFYLKMNYDNSQTNLINVANISNLTGVNINTSTSGEVIFNYNDSIGVSYVKDTLALLTFIQTGCETTLTWDTTNAISEFNYLGIFDLPAIFQNGEIGFLDSSAAELISPVDQADQVFFQPTLSWYSEECVQDFQLQVALDPGFTNMIVDTLLGIDTSFQLLSLSDTTTYYWKVARIDLENSIYWSPIWDFTTEEAVVVQTKVHSASTYADTLVIPITLDSLEDAAAFELYLDYDNTVLDFVNYFDTTTFLSGVQVLDLNGQVQITWSSADSTINTAGQIVSDTLLQLRFAKVGNCYSDLTWNSATQFTHIVPIINLFSENTNALASFLTFDEPAAISPISMGGSTTLIYPELLWTSATCAIDYQVQVATDSLFTNVVIDTILNDTTFIPTVLQPNTSYYWRALKIDTDGSTFSSDTLMFITGNAYSSHFTLESISTETDSVNVSVMVDSLFWLTNLQLQIDFDTMELVYTGFSDTLLSGIIVSQNDGIITIDWSSTTPIGISGSTLLKLDFINKNTCSADLIWNITNSQLGYLVEGIQVPLIFEDGSINFIDTSNVVLSLPPDNSITLSETPTLIWRTEDCSEEYQLQVATDTFFTNIILDQVGLLDTTYSFTNNNNLSVGNDYFWRVARMDILDSLYWSEIWKFRVIAVSTQEVLQEEMTAKVYPNPFNHFLILEANTTTSDEFLDIEIYTINGQLIDQKHIQQSGKIQLELQTGDWSSGIYILKMQTRHRTKVIKLIK